jgi:hypothetical protein
VGWQVDCWLDPSCPLTRTTFRWLVGIADDVPLTVRWRVMSLSVLNEHRDDDPEDDPDGYLWIPARVAAAVEVEHGSAALGAFVEALWTEPDGTERADAGEDLAEALRRCGLPAELAEPTDAYDAALRASHRAGVSRVEAEIGTPVLTVTDPAGAAWSFFGPVVDTVPDAAAARRLWDAVVLLAGVPGFREIKL